MALENLEQIVLLLPLKRSEVEFTQLVEKAKMLQIDSKRCNFMLLNEFSVQRPYY